MNAAFSFCVLFLLLPLTMQEGSSKKGSRVRISEVGWFESYEAANVQGLWAMSGKVQWWGELWAKSQGHPVNPPFLPQGFLWSHMDPNLKDCVLLFQSRKSGSAQSSWGFTLGTSSEERRKYLGHIWGRKYLPSPQSHPLSLLCWVFSVSH